MEVEAIKFIDATQVATDISTAIGGLSSAFEYKGTIDANGDDYDADNGASSAPSAFPSSPEVGDYYKVATAGYFIDSGTEIFVNVGDAIVHNSASSGVSWDVLDNTNSTVSAGDDGADISVTGSTETGFVVGFSSTATLDQANQVVDGGTYS